MDYPVISADSHVVEPGNAYLDHMDRAWRERAPHIVEDDEGVRFILDGLAPVRVDVAASAGVPIMKRGDKRPYADVHRGAWDPLARLEDQKTDGIAAEVIYPTIGMFLYAHPDADFKEACFAAYTRWAAEFCGAVPERYFGCAPVIVKSPQNGVAELRAAKALGMRSVMLPNRPGVEDWDSRLYDPFWETAVELGMPLAFHTVAAGGLEKSFRGSKLNLIYTTIHAVQELLGIFVLTGIFERHPGLKLVCVEGDAGWLPHYAQRMDRFYREHKYFSTTSDLKKVPSEYIFENIYMTFQDDEVAFRYIDSLNPKRLMWANDFPHPDASWPNSQALLARQASHLSPQKRRDVLCDNAAKLYGIDVARLMN
ncbi:MAG TPA: amidohydrolase family protein [Alphaproteobacteria bacterium]|nr:amidohydrolase family protein [Alphaproteobacteria bacterium]